MDPLFSVILPTYNRAYVLWRAIQSVIAQSEPRWELLIVDDGSTDDTSRLLEEFRDPRIRVFCVSHAGASAARNYGVSRAQAPYLAYIDSDNTWRGDFLATMLSAIDRYSDGVLWYCGQCTKKWRRSADGQWTLEKSSIDARAQYNLSDVVRLQAGDTNCQVHRREILEKIGGWDERCAFLEDWDVFARFMLRYPERVYWVSEVLVDYRQVFGPKTDGLCAAVESDPDYARSSWRYLADKWQDQPGFEPMVQWLMDRKLI